MIIEGSTLGRTYNFGTFILFEYSKTFEILVTIPFYEILLSRSYNLPDDNFIIQINRYMTWS